MRLTIALVLAALVIAGVGWWLRPECRTYERASAVPMAPLICKR
jgi:uncharacterized membrane protein